jgi:histidyl-tRNA synthetase
LPQALAIAQELRSAGIACEVQLEARKLAKQFQYADKVGFSYMILYGESEQAKAVVSLKNLSTGKQVEIARSDLTRCLSQANDWGL